MRVRQVCTLAVGLALVSAGVARAGAGDDAHFLVQSATVSPNGTVTSNNVPCPSGEHAIGGGLRWPSFPKTLAIRGSGPLSSTSTVLDDGGAQTQWSNRATNLGTTDATMFSYGICSASTDATVVRVAKTTIAKDANDFNTGHATASCPTGQRAIGGGVVPETSGNIAFVMANGPVDETGQPSSTESGDVARGWFGAVNGPQGEVWRVYAICSVTSTATIQLASVVVSAGQGAGSGASGTTGVSCPTNQRALSGGMIDNAPYAWMIGSAPGGPASYASSVTPGVATGWRAFVWSQIGNSVEFKVAAICEGASSPNTPPPPVDPGEPPPPDIPPGTPDTVSNNFTIGRFFRDKDKGTGAIVLNVPGPGTVTLTSAKLKPQVNVANKAKDIGLSVKAAGGAPRHKLLSTGKLKAKVKLTFLPDGGTPSVQKDKLKLIYD